MFRSGLRCWGLSRVPEISLRSLNARDSQLLGRYVKTTRPFSQPVNPTCAPALTKDRAKSLILKLTEEERSNLKVSLKEFESQLLKEEYKGQLAAFRWRSKFGRPSSVPNLGDVDPTGSYCPVPEDWLLKKYAESVTKPTSAQLFQLGIVNAVPFVGFGFLDNSIMLICGDYIEATLGSVVVMTTMAAAALGNTFSDIIGIGSAYYVELAATKIGIKPPPLSPVQLDLKSSRVCSNLGRVIGVTIGCILGMTPLLFKKEKTNDDKAESSDAAE
uniref:Transmembrane protein 65 n=1 Tax=Lygus hesperus TaxID=30085 RepID=A0A146MFX0_LYGHE